MITPQEAKKMLKAKLECLKNETSGINYDCNMRLCDGCSLNYEQGNMGEQKEALEMAIKALEQQSKTIQEKQAESEKYQKAFDDGYENGYAQARFDYETQPCEDCISREETLKAFAEKCGGECGCCVYNGSGYDTAENCKLIKSMPSVTPKAESEEA